MAESTVYRNLIELPPNFLKREVLRTGANEREVLSSTRPVKHPIKRRRLWGVDGPKHSDIEKLPILAALSTSKIPAGINISQSSIHYSDQPCVITSITLPGKTSKDENDSLPLIRRNIEIARLPECLRPNLFTSQVSKFEVFPRFDPPRSQYDVASPRTLKQEIGPATQNALEKLSEILYRKSLYKTNFLPLESIRDTSFDKTVIGSRTPQEMKFGYQRAGIFPKVFGEKKRKIEMGNRKTKEEEEEMEEEKDEENDDQLKEEIKKMKAKLLYEKRNASTALPLFSPYQEILDDGNVSKPKIVLPPYWAGSLDKITRHQLETHTRAITTQDSLVRMKAIQRLKLGRKIGDDDIKLPSVPCGMSDDIKLPSIGAMLDDVSQLKEGNLVHQRRNKLPLMVGVRFKTDAHVKYHRNHPEPVPDLRDSIIDGKKHIFFGAHAMLLR